MSQHPIRFLPLTLFSAAIFVVVIVIVRWMDALFLLDRAIRV